MYTKEYDEEEAENEEEESTQQKKRRNLTFSSQTVMYVYYN